MTSPPAQGMLHVNMAVNGMTQQAATQQAPATGNMYHIQSIAIAITVIIYTLQFNCTPGSKVNQSLLFLSMLLSFCQETTCFKFKKCLHGNVVLIGLICAYWRGET